MNKFTEMHKISCEIVFIIINSFKDFKQHLFKIRIRATPLTLLPLSGVNSDPRGIFRSTLKWPDVVWKFPSVILSQILSRFCSILNFSNQSNSFCMKNRKPLGSILTPKLMKLVILVIWMAYIKSNAQILASTNFYFVKYHSKLKNENKMKIDSVLRIKLDF